MWLVIIGVAGSVCASAQNAESRQWRDGPLTWDDFREQSAAGTTRSEIAYLFRAEPERVHIHDTIVFRQRAILELNRGATWADPGSRDRTTLAYHQVVFDLAEVCRREMQREIILHSGRLDALDLTTNWIYQQGQERIRRFGTLCKYGADANVVEQHSAMARRELAAVAVLDTVVPAFKKTAFGIGVHVGMKYGAIAGRLGSSFRPPVGFNFSFDFGYKEWRSNIDMMLGGTRTLNAITEDPGWPVDKRLTFALGSLTLGYRVWRHGYWSMTPYAGAAFAEFSEPTTDQTDVDPAIKRVGPLGGLQVDYQIRRALKLLAPFTVGRSFNETMLRLNISTMPVTFDAGMNGTFIFIGAGVCWYSNFVRAKVPAPGN